MLTSVPHPQAGPPGLPLVPSGDSRLGLGPRRGSGGGAVSTPSSRTGKQRATTCVRDTSPGRLGWFGLLPALLLINQRSASLGAQGPLTPPPSDERAEVQDADGVTESPRFISVFCCVPGALSLSPPPPPASVPRVRSWWVSAQRACLATLLVSDPGVKGLSSVYHVTKVTFLIASSRSHRRPLCE